MAKRKRVGQGGRRKRRKQRIPKLLRSPMPLTFKTALRYFVCLTVNPFNGSVPAMHVFTCNGLFDPDITGFGHQPRGFDQLMALYDHYVCTDNQLRVTYYPTAGETVPIAVIVAVKDSPTVGLSKEDYLENQPSHIQQLSAIQGYPTTVNMSVNPVKYLGRRSALSDPQLKGSIAANPAEQCFWHIGATGIFNADDPSPVALCVEITYDVTFIEPKDPGQS